MFIVFQFGQSINSIKIEFAIHSTHGLFILNEPSDLNNALKIDTINTLQAKLLIELNSAIVAGGGGGVANQIPPANWLPYLFATMPITGSVPPSAPFPPKKGQTNFSFEFVDASRFP